MNIFKEIKEYLTALQAAEQYGIKINRNKMVLIDILFDDPLVKLNSAIIDYNHCQWQGLRRHKCPIDNDFVYEAKQSSRA